MREEAEDIGGEQLDPYVQWIVTEARRPVALQHGARERLMSALRAEPPVAYRSSRLAWLTQPREFAMRPLTSLAIAAGLVGVGVAVGLLGSRDGRQTGQALPVAVVNPQLPDSLAPRAIKFVLVAPQAGRVSLVGDFNQWNASATPLVRSGSDGTWTAFVTLQPGLHTYSFVVDGTHFVADPAAPMAPDDGFGHRSSIMLVRRQSS